MSPASTRSTAPVWFITGASSGFGQAIALEALSRGHRVVATARKASSLEPVKAAGASVLALDVTAADDVVKGVVDRAADIYGGLTYVVSAAGYVLEGAVEECSAAEVAAQFATNVLGTVAVSRHALPHLRAAARSQPSGPKPVLATFGSLGSWQGDAAFGVYASTKFAVTGLTESLHAELEPLGVAAVVVEPGYFRTEFLHTSTAGGPERRIKAETVIPAYDDTAVGAVRRALDQANDAQLGDPVKGATVIVDVLTRSGVAEGREIPMRLVLGSDIVKAIRDKCARSLGLVKEWESIAASTDHT